MSATTAESIITEFPAKFRDVKLTAESEVELARLTDLAISIESDEGSSAAAATQKAHYLQMIDSAISTLSDPDPKLHFARAVRHRILLNMLADKPGLAGWIRRQLGKHPLNSVILGMIGAALLCALIFVVSWLVAKYTSIAQDTASMNVKQVGPLVLAAFSGTVVSMMTRLGFFSDLIIFDPMLLFSNAVLKPVASSVIAIFIFSLFMSEIVKIPGIEFTGEKQVYTLWILGFLAGFSERFASDFVGRAENLFGTSDKKLT